MEGIDLPAHDITDRTAMLALASAGPPGLHPQLRGDDDVDGCARDPELAYRANGMGVQNLALAAGQRGALSSCRSAPTRSSTAPRPSPITNGRPAVPINAYGRSKLAGEWYAQHLLTRAYIVRTAWLYAVEGTQLPAPHA